jgi:hypothetical protein
MCTGTSTRLPGCSPQSSRTGSGRYACTQPLDDLASDALSETGESSVPSPHKLGCMAHRSVPSSPCSRQQTSAMVLRLLPVIASCRVSRLHIWLCRVRLCTNKRPTRYMACVLHTARQVFNLAHQRSRQVSTAFERLVTTCRSTPR